MAQPSPQQQKIMDQKKTKNEERDFWEVWLPDQLQQIYHQYIEEWFRIFKEDEWHTMSALALINKDDFDKLDIKPGHRAILWVQINKYQVVLLKYYPALFNHQVSTQNNQYIQQDNKSSSQGRNQQIEGFCSTPNITHNNNDNQPPQQPPGHPYNNVNNQPQQPQQPPGHPYDNAKHGQVCCCAFILFMFIYVNFLLKTQSSNSIKAPFCPSIISNLSNANVSSIPYKSLMISNNNNNNNNIRRYNVYDDDEIKDDEFAISQYGRQVCCDYLFI